MSYVVALPSNSYKPITNTVWVRARLCKLKKGALNSQPRVIKFTSCLLMVCGSLRALRLLPPQKAGRHDIAEILLKVAFKHQKSIKIKSLKLNLFSSLFTAVSIMKGE